MHFKNIFCRNGKGLKKTIIFAALKTVFIKSSLI